MKTVLSLGTMVLVLAGGILFGQDVQQPFSYTFENGVGECVFTAVSLDQVWSVAVKVLMQNKFRIASAEKQSSTIRAEKRPAMSWNYDLSLYFEQRGEDVSVAASVLPTEKNQSDPLKNIGTTKAGYKEGKKFFDKVAELLYEKVKK